MLRKRRPESIDQIVHTANLGRKARENREIQRRIDLSKKLGERVMNGERFGGIPTFLAIAYPALASESSEYKELVDACQNVRRIQTGSLIEVGKNRHGAVGIKGHGGNKGLVFEIKPRNGTYTGTANVLCTQAIYMENEAATAEIHGSDDTPYPVGFIDSSVPITRSVTVLTPAALSTAPVSLGYHDRYPDGTAAFTSGYTSRILEAVNASIYTAA